VPAPSGRDSAADSRPGKRSAGLRIVGDLSDDDLMTSVNLESARRPPLRVAAIGGLTFSVLFVAHHLLQGTGPDSSSTEAVAAYNVAHRGPLLASEVAIGLALLAFIAFLAPLTAVSWRSGQESLAVAVLVAGAVFLAMGFLSTAAETALVGVADSNEPAAVDVLNQLQGRTPVVWTVTALATTISLTILRTGLLWRWLGITGLVLAAIFLLASISSLIGRSVEGGYSLIGVGIFIVWMLVLSGGLWRTASGHGTPPRP
jgi:hypothetical protein